ncbi:MAG: GHKL domain-containing protein [Firmicutes bacterium]|nr:GHKL domain-containing protein [Bacillota bacterium]
MDYRLADLLDVSSLNRMLDSFSEIFGMAIVVVDAEGIPLFKSSQHKVCLNYHRAFPISLERCRQNEETVNGLLRKGSLASSRCLNGMMDYAMPIVIEGERLGALIVGQFFNEEPDESFFLRQAGECGFDEAAYLEAVRRVPVIPAERVGHIVEFLNQFVHTLTMMGLERLRKVRVEAAEAEQERLEAKAAMSRAERLVSIGTLAAAVSHEISQPLNYIKLTASSILYWHQRRKQMELDQVMDMIQEISNEVDRIEKTITHLKTLVRKPETELELCDLNAAVGRALELVGKQMEAHRVGLTLELEDKGMNVWATMTGLEEITINLLVNAVQALDTVEGPGKEIRVRTRVERKSVVLEVADNGPGVSEEMKQKIFEPFFTTKPAGENTGLGLAIVYTLAANYQGRLEVENTEPRGATFRMVLPLADG